MTTPRRSITILGAGHIGFAMALLLSRSGDYEVLVADRDPLRLHAVAALGVATCTTGDDAELQRAIEGRFAVLNALPFHCAVGVATLCARAGVHYFDLTEDVDQGRKRWITVAAPGGGPKLVLARAEGAEQAAAIGAQGGGRVWLFLTTDDFARDAARLTAAGARFEEAPRHEPYGTVAVWRDPWGNRWDLIGPPV